jgi:hypothetical protein
VNPLEIFHLLRYASDDSTVKAEGTVMQDIADDSPAKKN